MREKHKPTGGLVSLWFHGGWFLFEKERDFNEREINDKIFNKIEKEIKRLLDGVKKS